MSPPDLHLVAKFPSFCSLSFSSEWSFDEVFLEESSRSNNKYIYMSLAQDLSSGTESHRSISSVCCPIQRMLVSFILPLFSGQSNLTLL